MTAVLKEEKPADTKVIVADAPYSKRGEVPAPQAQPATLIHALAAAAADPRMDVAKIERLYAMHKEMMDRAAQEAFNDAMARAQAEIQPVAAKAINSHTSSAYAKLEAIDRVITPIHTKHGLSISYDTETKNEADPIPDGYLRIVAIVAHSGGHSRRHHIDLPPDDVGSQGKTNKTKVQAIGSTNTYGRRYLKMMIFNVSTFDDRDGNSGRVAGGKAMDEKVLVDHLAALDAASDADSLNKAFGKAWNAAEELKDKAAQAKLIEHRDDRRKALRVRA